MDINKDETIDDKEWIEFFHTFLAPFQECDTNEDWKLDIDETTVCLEGILFLINLIFREWKVSKYQRCIKRRRGHIKIDLLF